MLNKNYWFRLSPDSRHKSQELRTEDRQKITISPKKPESKDSHELNYPKSVLAMILKHKNIYVKDKNKEKIMKNHISWDMFWEEQLPKLDETIHKNETFLGNSANRTKVFSVNPEARSDIIHSRKTASPKHLSKRKIIFAEGSATVPGFNINYLNGQKCAKKIKLEPKEVHKYEYSERKIKDKINQINKLYACQLSSQLKPATAGVLSDKRKKRPSVSYRPWSPNRKQHPANEQLQDIDFYLQTAV